MWTPESLYLFNFKYHNHSLQATPAQLYLRLYREKEKNKTKQNWTDWNGIVNSHSFLLMQTGISYLSQLLGQKPHYCCINKSHTDHLMRLNCLFFSGETAVLSQHLRMEGACSKSWGVYWSHSIFLQVAWKQSSTEHYTRANSKLASSPTLILGTSHIQFSKSLAVKSIPTGTAHLVTATHACVGLGLNHIHEFPLYSYLSYIHGFTEAQRAKDFFILSLGTTGS